MIVAVLLLLQAATPASDGAAAVDRRLSTWRGTLNDGVCKTRTSSGDAAVDRIGCTAMERCTPQFESRVQRAHDRAIRPEVKKVMLAALKGELTQCVDSERKAGIAALVAQRGAY